MEEELSFPLERSPAMKLLGWLWTGSIPGQFIIAMLIFIAVIFMGSQEFSVISILFSVFFILPVIFIIHFRLVRKSKRVMMGWCDLKFYKESQILEFKSGFPNTMNPDLQEVEITDDNRNIYINGGEVGGYSLRLGQPEDIRKATRLGLWISLEDAKMAAEDLQQWLKGDIELDLSSDKKSKTSKKDETTMME